MAVARAAISFIPTVLILHCELAFFGTTVRRDIVLSDNNFHAVVICFVVAWIALHLLLWAEPKENS